MRGGLVFLIVLGCVGACERSEKPPNPPAAPAEPIELFNGKDLTGWSPYGRLQRNRWTVGAAALNHDKKQTLRSEPGGSDLLTTDIVGSDLVTDAKFRDFALSFEFMLPSEGNSGVYLLGQYELQISHEPQADDDMAIGSVPRLVPPRTRVPIEPGKWHKYDIEFRAPRFNAKGEKTANAMLIRVAIDGVVVHENAEIPHETVGAIEEGELPEGPVMLQGSHTSVAFRNIVLTPR